MKKLIESLDTIAKTSLTESDRFLGGVHHQHAEYERENDQSTEPDDIQYQNGDRVRLHPDYADSNPKEIFTVSDCDGDHCRISDDSGRGWGVKFFQLIPVDHSEDVGNDLEEDISNTELNIASNRARLPDPTDRMSRDVWVQHYKRALRNGRSKLQAQRYADQMTQTDNIRQEGIDSDIYESLKVQFEDFVKTKEEEKKTLYTITYNDGHTTTMMLAPKEKQEYESKAAVAKVDRAKKGTKRSLQNSKLGEGKAENRQLYDRIKSKGVVLGINRERYTDLSHEGLEGPFHLRNGKTVYYDPKEGKYYDRDSDMYISHKDYEMMNEDVTARTPDAYPHALDLAQHMRPETRDDAFSLLNLLRDKYGKDYSLKVYKLAQRIKALKQASPHLEESAITDQIRREELKDKIETLRDSMQDSHAPGELSRIQQELDYVRKELAKLKSNRPLKEDPVPPVAPGQSAGATQQKPGVTTPTAPGQQQTQQSAGATQGTNQQKTSTPGVQFASGSTPTAAPAAKPAATPPAAEPAAPTPGQPVTASNPGQPAAGTNAAPQDLKGQMNQLVQSIATDPAGAKQLAAKIKPVLGQG